MPSTNLRISIGTYCCSTCAVAPGRVRTPPCVERERGLRRKRSRDTTQVARLPHRRELDEGSSQPSTPRARVFAAALQCLGRGAEGQQTSRTSLRLAHAASDRKQSAASRLLGAGASRRIATGGRSEWCIQQPGSRAGQAHAYSHGPRERHRLQDPRGHPIGERSGRSSNHHPGEAGLAGGRLDGAR